MRILGPPSAPRTVVLRAVAAQPGVHLRFVHDMFPALWDAAAANDVDPVGVVAQAFKETGGGQFRGRVKPEFCNTCGLKNRQPLFPGVDDGDLPLAHARFASWRVGALAHVQHVLAYAGVPVGTLIVDPRFELVTGSRLENFEDLGGRWAPDLNYGKSVVEIARRLQAA